MNRFETNFIFEGICFCNKSAITCDNLLNFLYNFYKVTRVSRKD
jgi:hypothetical protein